MPHTDHILTNSNPFVSTRLNVTLWEQIYVLTNNNNNDKLCITGRLCFGALTQPTLDGGVADVHILFEALRFDFAVFPLADSFSLTCTLPSLSPAAQVQALKTAFLGRGKNILCVIPRQQQVRQNILIRSAGNENGLSTHHCCRQNTHPPKPTALPRFSMPWQTAKTAQQQLEGHIQESDL